MVPAPRPPHRIQSQTRFHQHSRAEGCRKTAKSGKLFLIQKHDATRLHYDFRLEWKGVLKSWAVTRGPSLNPEDKRLAVRTEDHPLAYGDFEGTIPEKQYGGGTVMLWDTGWWEPDNDPDEGLKEGKLKFHVHGQRMHRRLDAGAHEAARRRETRELAADQGEDDAAAEPDGESLINENIDQRQDRPHHGRDRFGPRQRRCRMSGSSDRSAAEDVRRVPLLAGEKPSRRSATCRRAKDRPFKTAACDPRLRGPRTATTG